MISRVWHGWTTRDDADTDEQWLRNEVLPVIHRVRGFQGASLLRRDLSEEVEFVTITMFESLDAVKEFAGEDYKVAVVPTGARRLLSRFDACPAHYETVFHLH
jgi:heme-degrading monooxygenase HmoA